MINRFTDEHFFLSNFYPSQIELDGMTFESVEAAFQAAKTLDMSERRQFVGKNPSEAKRLGRRNVVLRSDWEEVKYGIMLDLVRQKFKNQGLKQKLLDTGDQYLVEGNDWHDNIWGDCDCFKCQKITGKNNLGKILMKVREELKAQ